MKRKAAELAARGLAGAVNALGRVPPLKRLLLMTGERLRVDEGRVPTRWGELRFAAPNEVTQHRVESFHEKEPETLAWIDELDGGALYDVGANVGTYSLYAALSGKVEQVIALEPESQNYAALNRNIALNGQDGKIAAYNVAASDRTRLDRLHLSTVATGYANHNFGASRDYNRQDRVSAFRQGAVSYTLDDFIAAFGAPFPRHIKVDVDGLEPEIIKGAAKTIADPRLKSLLIEINEALPEFMAIVETLKKAGFSATRNDHARMFDAGPYDRLFNYVFRR